MYEIDITDEQWEEIEKILRPPSTTYSGKYNLRLIVEAILYLEKTGLPWRKLPKRFPPFPGVSARHQRWKKKGRWEKVLKLLNIESTWDEKRSRYTLRYNVSHKKFIELFEKKYRAKSISEKLKVPVSVIHILICKYYIKKYVRRQETLKESSSIFDQLTPDPPVRSNRD